MQHDSSVSHIAITCPHCGKHYRKVPYEAIRKYRFAFCKKCNAKFHITAEELEKALRQAAAGLQQQSPPAPEVSQAPLPQEQPGQEQAPAGTAHAPQTPESHGLERTLEKKISDLAATMEETFSQAPEADQSGGAEEPLKNAPAEAPAAAAPGPDSLPLEGLPDFAPAAQPAAGYPESPAGDEGRQEEAVPGADRASPGQQGAEDAGFSTELASSYPGQEEHVDEPPADVFTRPPHGQAPGREAAGPAAPAFEEPPSPDAAATLPGDAADAGESRDGETAPVEGGGEPAPEEATAASWPEITGLPHEAPEDEHAGPAETPVGEAAPAESEPETFEEELLDESLIEDEVEPAGQEAPLPQDQSTDDAALLSMQAGSSEPGGETGAARDVSAMLRQLALPADTVEEGMEQFVLFTLGEHLYAAPISNVNELSLPPELIPVPNTPRWVQGISNMRGEIISVVDFREFLDIEAAGLKKPGRMIIAQTQDRAMVIGLLVDSIRGIKYFPVDEIEPLDQQEHALPDAFCQGACMLDADTVVFLDLEQILMSPKMRQFQ